MLKYLFLEIVIGILRILLEAAIYWLLKVAIQWWRTKKRRRKKS